MNTIENKTDCLPCKQKQNAIHSQIENNNLKTPIQATHDIAPGVLSMFTVVIWVMFIFFKFFNPPVQSMAPFQMDPTTVVCMLFLAISLTLITGALLFGTTYKPKKGKVKDEIAK